MRVLVANDAILFRRVLSDALASLPGVEVVGSAANGRIADAVLPLDNIAAKIAAVVRSGRP